MRRAHLGVAQLAERVPWEHEAGSSSLPTQTIPDKGRGNATRRAERGMGGRYESDKGA